MSVGGKVGGAGVKVGRTVAVRATVTVRVGVGRSCAIKSLVRQPSTISPKKLTRAIIRVVNDLLKRVSLATTSIQLVGVNGISERKSGTTAPVLLGR